MKNRLLYVAIIPCLAITIYFLFQTSQARLHYFGDEDQAEAPFMEFSKALKEEEAMLRDPRTGNIPEGIHELELMQAKEILNNQLAKVSGTKKIESSNTYTYQGPNNYGGRTRAIAFDVGDLSGKTIIAGSVSGGVYKTTNGGASWTRVSPNNQRFTITAVAQDPRPCHQNIWYYGGGEGLGNSASENGDFY